MTDTREKLLEHINYYTEHVPHEDGQTWEEAFADHLIANGVTVQVQDCDKADMDFCGVLCNFADDLIEKAKRQKWIPVTERLPEKDGRYICVVRIGRSGAVYVKIMNGDSYGFSLEHIYTDDVTHWMPMPEPPKEGN